MGSYQDAEGADSCQLCPVGYFCDSVGLSIKRPCEAGKFQVLFRFGFLLIQKAVLSDRTTLSFIQSSAGKTYCSQCAPGSYQDVSGSALCNACPLGSFCPSLGSTDSVPCVDVDDLSQYCPEGSITTGMGQFACGAISCELGIFFTLPENGDICLCSFLCHRPLSSWPFLPRRDDEGWL